MAVAKIGEDICGLKIYRGLRTLKGTEVMVDGMPLDPRIDLREMLEVGFELRSAWPPVSMASRPASPPPPPLSMN